VNPYWVAVSIVGGYLLGSISFARVVGRLVIPAEDLARMDLPIEGSERTFRASSISATTIRVKAGSRYGCLTSVLDMLKATLPALVLRLVFPASPYYLFAAAAAVGGHDFPIYHGFRGGRGISPIYGGLFVIDWLAIPVTTIVGSLVGGLALRHVVLSYFGVTLMLVPWLWWRFGDWPHLVYAAAVNLFFWASSIPEFREYLRHRRQGDYTADPFFIGGGSRNLWEALGVIFRRIRERRRDQDPPGDES
jgi:glycerol-3-phosphate acyltransferase PlsY